MTLAWLILAGLPTMAHGVAPTHSGCVVAAPHEGFDDHTAPIARAVAERLGWGWVVATGYRDRDAGRWLDVNRPTERVFQGGAPQPAEVTSRGRKTYAEYQGHLQAAAGGDGPLDLLVEVHGHARVVEVEGERQTLQAIELATQGFSKPELWKLKRRYLRLVRQLPRADRVPLAVEQLDAHYSYEGTRVPFYFRASGSKRRGSLRPSRARRSLHFELPQKVRFDEARRGAYAELLADLVSPLPSDQRTR